VLDGLLFERRGVPAASIVTDLFDQTGRAMVMAWGVPSFKFLTMPHPTANLTEEELDQRARDIAPKVAQLLLQGHGRL
jgi:hypothetical protein